ncbi:MAG: ABC transporter permease [Deltaproteobacteria bacterium]|nr:ABC transporter permease [Deltaproteobacteria bacterium]
MLISFIKITLRKLYREKLYTIINVSGLALGIACCLILGLFLHNELTYDQHHKNYKRIYRVAALYTIQGTGIKFAHTSEALPSLLKKENSDVIDYVRFVNMALGYPQGIAYHSGDNTAFWKNVYLVDDNVFEVFTYDVIYGDPKTALVDPNSIAISETFAKKYFGDANPIDKTIRNDVASFKISLVFADLPYNTHLKTDVLMSYNAPDRQLNASNLRQDLWIPCCYTYLVFPENYPQESFKKMTEAFYQKYMKETGDADNVKQDFWLQPLKDIHYMSSGLTGDLPTGNVLYLYGSAAVGLLILLVACINYMNLSTARSLKRGREVGIYRVMGANKSQLILQFIGESIVITLIALFLGMLVAELVLFLSPIKETIGNLQLTQYVTNPVLLCWLIGSTIFTGVVSGVYPAFYLSSIQPIAALKAIKKVVTVQFKFRQILVLAQFIISIGVIACTFLMISQMQYIANKPLGFTKENRLVVSLIGSDVIEKHNMIKTELLKNPNVKGMTICNSVPGDFGMPAQPKSVENNDGSMVQLPMTWVDIYNDDYLHVMGMKLVEGRDFSNEFATDPKEAVIVNEALVRNMGWDKPLGKRIEEEYPNTKYKVIGVVQDFHYQSMYSSVEPVMLDRNDYVPSQNRPQDNKMIIISISGKEMSQTIDHIKNVMKEFDSRHPFHYEFLDELIDNQYVFEKRVIGLTGTFAGICVFISCLGLFGLSAFTTEQRSKEIGIRKVVGASTMQIILMLFKPTMVLVLIGAVIASASAYLVMEKWLAGFAYKADINPLVFVMATLIVIIVAFVTIALQSLKTAQANPVEALRYE